MSGVHELTYSCLALLLLDLASFSLAAAPVETFKFQFEGGRNFCSPWSAASWARLLA